MGIFTRLFKKRLEETIPVPAPVEESHETAAGFFPAELLRQYNLEPNGENFYKLGYGITQRANAERFVSGYIDPLFINLENELRLKMQRAMGDNEQRLGELNKTIDDSAKQLDANLDNGQVKQLTVLIEKARIDESKMDCLAYPERELDNMLHAAFRNFESQVPGPGSQQANLPESINDVIKPAISFRLLKLIMWHFKDFTDSLTTIRHSLLYPPKIRYIIAFYVVSLVLFCTEVGFSTPIIKLLSNGSSEYLSFLYSIGISIAFAVFFKIFIERMLFKNKKNTWQFMGIVLVAIFILVFFFSYTNRHRGMLKPSFHGVVLAFFSVCFSLANAFLIREALYLHHLYFRLNGKSSLRVLTQKKEAHISKWSEIQNAAQSEKGRKERLLSWQKDQFSSQIASMIANLKAMSIAAFWRGFDQNQSDIIHHHKELTNALIKKLNL